MVNRAEGSMFKVKNTSHLSLYTLIILVIFTSGSSLRLTAFDIKIQKCLMFDVKKVSSSLVQHGLDVLLARLQ